MIDSCTDVSLRDASWLDLFSIFKLVTAILDLL